MPRRETKPPFRTAFFSVSLAVFLLLDGCGGGSTPPTPTQLGPDPEQMERAARLAAQGAPQLLPEISAVQQVESVEEMAASLARQVLAGGEEAKPALLKAIQAAGFAVFDGEKDKIVSPPTLPAHLVMFKTWEVDLLAQAAGRGVAISFADLSADLDAIARDLPGPRLGDYLLESIRLGLQDTSPTGRFWANFVVELGRHAAVPYDLRANADPASIRLDPIQTIFALRRLASDLLIVAALQSAEMPPSKSLPHQSPSGLHEPKRKEGTRSPQGYRQDGPSPLLSAVWDQRPPVIVRVQNPSPPSTFDPCSLIGPAFEALDPFWPYKKIADEIEKTVTEKVEEAFKERAGDVATELGKEAKDTVDLGPLGPGIQHRLKQNKFTKGPTEQYTKAQEKIEKGEKEFKRTGAGKTMEGMKTAKKVVSSLGALGQVFLIAFNIKTQFSMEAPAPPLERLKKKGVKGKYSRIKLKASYDLGALGDKTRTCLKLALNSMGLKLPENGPVQGAEATWELIKGGGGVEDPTGAANIKSPIVELDPPLSARTTDQGVTDVGVHGAPQKKTFPDNAPSVKKEATVKVNIQLNPADFLKDFKEAFAARKNPGLIPAHLLERAIKPSAYYTFEVIDWEDGYVLEFDSVIEGTAPMVNAGVRSHAHATVLLEKDDSGNVKGKGDLVYTTTGTNLPIPGRLCQTSITGQGSTRFEVVEGHVNPETAHPDIEVVIRVDRTWEDFRMVCPKLGVNKSGQTNFWGGMFNVGRFKKFNQNKGGYVIGGDWTLVNEQGVIATKTMLGNCGMNICIEKTTFTLKGETKQ